MKTTRIFASVLSVVTALCIFLPQTGRSEAYSVQPGDVLELTVAGLPELRARMPVDIDGNVVAPLAGVLPVAGRTLEDILGDVRVAVSMVPLPSVSGGAVSTIHVSPSSITVSLAEYGPIYVDGDVRAAGAYPFLPGLTVRQAIALAGGFGFGRFGTGDPFLETTDLRSEIEVLATQREATRARMARLSSLLSELDNAPGAAIGSGVADGIAGSESPAGDRQMTVRFPESVRGIEARRLALQRAGFAQDEDHYEAAIAATRKRADTLEAQLEAETAGYAADQADFERLAELQQAGAITAARMSDARRVLLYSTTRTLQTGSELARAERDAETLSHELTQLKLERRDAAVEKLSEETVALAEIEAKLDAARQNLIYIGGIGEDIWERATAEVAIERRDGSTIKLTGTEDAALRPRDLLRVTLSLKRQQN